MTRDEQEELHGYVKFLEKLKELEKSDGYRLFIANVKACYHQSHLMALNATEPMYAMKMMGAAYAYNEVLMWLTRNLDATKGEVRRITPSTP